MQRLQFTASDGLRIPVQVRGSGPPLVIVPGWTSNPADWEPVIRRLARHFRCHIWINRAALNGPDPGVQRMAADLADLLRALALQKPLVMGHSMGAVTLWEHVRQSGCDHLGALAFIDQSPKLITDEKWTLGLYQGFNSVDNAAFVAALKRNFTATVMGLVGSSRSVPLAGALARVDRLFLEARRQYIASLRPEPWIHCWQSLAAADCRDVPGDISVPSFLAYGACSAFYGPGVARWVHAHTPGSRLHLYEGAAHSPHLEAITAFVDDLATFARAHYPE